MASETIIENRKGLQLLKTLKEIYSYRELLWTLAWRDFKVRYAQTLLGFTWAIIEPLVTVFLLSLVFNRVASASTFGINPILFGLTGMICWNYFSNVVSQGSTSLITSQNMIKKIYFPKMIIPLSKSIAALPDLLVTLLFTFLFMLFYNPGLSVNAWLFPVFILLSILAASALGIWFSALNIRFRDFVHVVPFIIRIGLFITPIAYSTNSVESSYKWLFFLNPMTGIIEGMRWAIFGHSLEIQYFSLSMLMLIIFLFGGILYFQKMQKNIADII